MKRIAILLVFVVSYAQGLDYDGYRLFRLSPKTKSQEEKVRKIGLGQLWKFDRSMDVMVGPDNLQEMLQFVQENKIENSVLIPDVQKLINRQKIRNRSPEFDFNDYHPLDVIYGQLRKFDKKYKQVKLVKGGETYEGRDILGVHVSFSKQNRNKTIFLEAGIHAAEWIAPATVMYILNDILTSKDPQVRKVAESYDWYVFPSFNPDGYVYSHETDRLWRKTRTPYGCGNCTGTDANRNWDFHWMEIGASNDSCNNFYGGPEPFSEIETRTLSNFIESIHHTLVGYIAFHSYGQYFLIPYSQTAEYLDNYQELKALGDDAADVLKQRHGTQFQVGTFHTLLWPASGVSVDWVKGNFHVPITYTVELRDKGQYGFLLPPDQIIPTAEETRDAIMYILEEGKKLI